MTQNVLFDLDGTLLDSKLGIIRCVNHALVQLGARPRSDAELVRMIGPPLVLGFPQFLDEGMSVEAAVVAYRERYEQVGIFECELFPKVEWMLDQLAGSGRRLFVVTAKPRPYATKLVDHFSLQDRVEAVFAPALDDERDGKAHLIQKCLESAQLDVSRTAMVGDRDRDVMGAKATGVAPIGVLWGYGTRAELSDCNPDRLVSTPSELVTVLGTHDFRRS